jgi:hypothetical protein
MPPSPDVKIQLTTKAFFHESSTVPLFVSLHQNTRTSTQGYCNLQLWCRCLQVGIVHHNLVPVVPLYGAHTTCGCFRAVEHGHNGGLCIVLACSWCVANFGFCSKLWRTRGATFTAGDDEDEGSSSSSEEDDPSSYVLTRRAWAAEALAEAARGTTRPIALRRASAGRTAPRARSPAPVRLPPNPCPPASPTTRAAASCGRGLLPGPGTRPSYIYTLGL